MIIWAFHCFALPALGMLLLLAGPVRTFDEVARIDESRIIPSVKDQTKVSDQTGSPILQVASQSKV